MGILRLASKAAYTLKNEGVNMLILKTKTYVSNKRYLRKNRDLELVDSMFGDVLFINGCFLPHPSRYRVAHQREQMLANGVISEEVLYTDLKLDYVKRFRLFIFYRCPWTEMIDQFIKTAKSFNKTCLFDIDDLVIDTKYTDSIPFLQSMSAEEKKQYDYGVNAMQKTLKMCEGAITTTEGLAEELKHYTSNVFINRNVASDAMAVHSDCAVYERDILPHTPDSQLSRASRKKKKKVIAAQKADEDIVKIGYFSGSITHNDDIDMILPVIKKIMQDFEQVRFYFVGELDIPEAIKPFSERICTMPFVDWTELPKLIANVDINITPLCDTVFNAAKSENKWTEAALVKVPTVASNIGAFQKMIVNGETGLLCNNDEEWYSALSSLIRSKKLRRYIAQRAFEYVTQNCLTINSGAPLCEFVKTQMKPNIAFVLPSMQLSGGSQVVLKYCVELKKAGVDVLVINDNEGEKNAKKDGEEINVLSARTCAFHGSLDTAVGTLWSTMTWVRSYLNISKRAYLVQGYETGFYKSGIFFQFSANQTYSLENIRYITVSKWCESWLREKFHQQPAFIPNGLDRKLFYMTDRDFKGKVRILIEGNSDDYYKNIDESFEIVRHLDKNRFEIWFLSYLGNPKEWYHVDKFLHKVPYEKVGDIYRQCDILLKSSLRESFSYPPLEMMSTGGYVVVRPNEGNVEYLKDKANCLMYDGDDLQTAVDAIEKIASDPALRQRLFEGGQKTADERSWDNYRKKILDVYMNSEEKSWKTKI